MCIEFALLFNHDYQNVMILKTNPTFISPMLSNVSPLEEKIAKNLNTANQLAGENVVQASVPLFVKE